MTCEVPVFYATTEGHTRKIAVYLADRFRSRGYVSAAIPLDAPEAGAVDWAHVRGVVLGASIHRGKHQKEALRFARTNRGQLNGRPSAFFSVSLSAASSHPEEVAAARNLARDFVETTRWYADRVVSVAGVLAYTRYGVLKRLLMRQIAKKEGASTDTSCDHEYTDWKQVDQLADDLAAAMHGMAPVKGAA